jgi:ribosomal protein S18 acetylase RimI-like enzyme
MKNEECGAVFLKITLHRMYGMYLNKLKAALQPLSVQQLWEEDYQDGNTIGGIALHVCEHVSRSCLRLTGQEHRLQESFHLYFPDRGLTAEQLAAMLEEQFNLWRTIIERYVYGAEEFTVEHIHHLYHLVEHTGYHLGQIIDRAQAKTGIKFKFYDNGLNESRLRSQIDDSLLLFRSDGFYAELITAADAPELAQVYNSNPHFLAAHMNMDAVSPEWVIAEWRSMLEERFLSCKITESGTGRMMGLMDFQAGGEEAYLSLLMLHEDFRGKGWGTRIYQAFEQYATAAGSSSVRLDVVTENDRTVQAFWSRNGFAVGEAVELNWAGRVLPAVVMKKKLGVQV